MCFLKIFIQELPSTLRRFVKIFNLFYGRGYERQHSRPINERSTPFLAIFCRWITMWAGITAQSPKEGCQATFLSFILINISGLRIEHLLRAHTK